MAPPNRPEEARPDERMTAWMAEYGPALRRYFGRSVGPAEAEDLVQEVFLAMQEISPERSLIAKQTAAGVLTALQALPPRTAEAFLLHRFEEMTYTAIAAHMGVSVKAVEALIARAMKRVGAALEARP